MKFNNLNWVSTKNYIPKDEANVLIYDGKNLIWTGFYDHSEKEWKSTFKLDANCAFYYEDIPQDWYVFWSTIN